ncbi:TIGR00159 family protein [Erysipelothrix sp. HDW6C]|uniref:diadenylate cyclase CdaA n=1 Tax=Erysipelothrix sp. HDW6C TaxID=2714930 RepID=UPI001408BF45|nr:diadenylate cyclase CdaA [Erysipelothrix sp. HDW6C]QIK69347.1 TIGR00159 family protein [Erysipelothrix sp. HDW6C]
MQFTLLTFQSIIQSLKVVVDFLIVWVLVYYVLRIVRNNSRTVQIFKGIVLIITMRFIAVQINLTTIKSLLDFALQNGILVFVIIFQPELRSMLERLGKTSVFSALHSLSGNEKDKLIDELVDATTTLSERKTGALITLEQGHSLTDYVKTGTAINSSVTSELLTSIFVTSTPLHDGAVIIQGDRIAAASAYFPPTNQELPTRYGARHRAAIGISEMTDSITIVVSEETGTISIAEGGKLREMDEKSLREYLNLLIQNTEKEVSQAVTTKRSRKLNMSKLNIDPIKIEKVDSSEVVFKEKSGEAKEKHDISKLMGIFKKKPKKAKPVAEAKEEKAEPVTKKETDDAPKVDIKDLFTKTEKTTKAEDDSEETVVETEVIEEAVVEPSKEEGGDTNE